MIWCELKIKAQVQVQAWTLIWTFFKAHAKTWSYLRTQDQVWPAIQLCLKYLVFYQPQSGMVMQNCRSKNKKGTYGFLVSLFLWFWIFSQMMLIFRSLKWILNKFWNLWLKNGFVFENSQQYLFDLWCLWFFILQIWFDCLNLAAGSLENLVLLVLKRQRWLSGT